MQPQTLQIAVFLLYIDAAFLVIYGAFASLFGMALIAGSVGAGFGVANERKWGYGLAVAIAGLGLLPYALLLLRGGNVLSAPVIGLMFAVAKFALLIHPQSRAYQRIWFK